LNQIYGSLYANGHGTIYPDLFYVDAQSSITQSTTLPGFGFQNLSNIAEKSANSAVHHEHLAVSDKVVWQCKPTPSCGTLSVRRITAAILALHFRRFRG